MRKIQNNRRAGATARSTARWGTARQAAPAAFGVFGSVTAIQQRVAVPAPRWVAPQAPSVAAQTEAAMRQRRLSDIPAAQQAQLQTAYGLLDGGKGIGSEPLEALSSAVLRSELSERAAELSGAAAAKPDERAELTELDYAMLHLCPHPIQGRLSDELSKRLAACLPASDKASDLVAARRATHRLNEDILSQVGTVAEGDTQSPAACLRAVLSDNCCIVTADNSLSDQTMRCRCRLDALTTSGLLRQPGQKRAKVLLPGGLTIEVSRQPDPWEAVDVIMSGLRSDVTLADATYMVADLLKGSGGDFTLTACAHAGGAGQPVPSGREQLGIKLISPAQAAAPQALHSKQPSEYYSLIARVRRDQTSLFPPVVSLLVVRPDAPAGSQRGVLTWVRFTIDPKDGHTDTDRCYTCGETGHVALSCTAARDGHKARFQCFASVPLVAAAQSGPSGQRQTDGKQQQTQQQQAGFAVASGSRRAVNQMLNQRPALAAAAGAATSSSPTVPAAAVGAATSPSPTVPADAARQLTVVAHADAQEQVEEEPTDAAVIAESEQLFQLQQLEQQLARHHELLASCLDEQEGVAAGAPAEQLHQLQAAHSACLVTLKQATARAHNTVEALTAAPPLKRPKGKGQRGKQAKSNYESKLAAFDNQVAQRNTQLTAAQCEHARLQALSGQYQAFAARLQQYSSPCATPQPTTGSDNLRQLTLEVHDTVPQLAADSCESPLSPVILLPPDSQAAPPAVTAETLELPVGPDAPAAAPSPPTALVTATALPRYSAQTTATQSVLLEQQRDQQLAQRRDEFDAAEQYGTDAEQHRLLSAASASSSMTSAADGDADRSDTEHAEDPAADDDACNSDTDADDDSVVSGPSESSESECSDAASSRKARKGTVHDESPQHQQQQHTAPPARMLRSNTTSLISFASLSN